MLYQLTEELEMLRQVVSRMAAEKVAPRAAAIDEEDTYPWDLKELFTGQGLLGAGVPEAYGGSGQGLPAVCLIVEEIARASASASLIVAAQELGLMPILLAGSEGQKQKYLPELASGERICAFALTEPNAGSDAGGIKTRARREGGRYLISGQKCFITNGGVADVYTVFASTDPEKGLKGLSAFIVEKNFPGFAVGKKEKKMGVRGSPTAELIFEDCPVPAENLLGKEGDGFKIAMMTLDRTRPVIGAQAVGIAQGALDYAVNYTRERVQFGRPIASFQGLQFMMADMATKVEAARQLVYKAAFTIENAAELGVSPAGVSRYSSMCKLFASDVAMQVTVDAVQLLGGYGYMKEYPLERMMRDAKITQIYEGTNQIQRLVIARSLLEKGK
ncbi:acyl-CoA dehydrogenase [Desulfofundulus thermobenzoicus]|uniref:Acyl-CoA dehydrogenase n=1 Tax=Desulfofundulus thermobenzoicus TaxID=29376 RepID=A0A6N7IM85_9FIRM|nr:acyl-CoA dehydrogenase family protein [Desulfofundulus thermobenzoicus]MQL51085.1 acyl-CoA dehydrogenase [Desulfofundulus thermobenzoicus]